MDEHIPPVPTNPAYTLERLFRSARAGKRGLSQEPPEWLNAFDPGGTTGWARFQGLHLRGSGQLDTPDMISGPVVMRNHLQMYPCTHMVIENYRIYGNKKDQHVNSDVHTLRLIGAIETLLTLGYGPTKQLSLGKQLASAAKGFVTDERLEDLGLWQKGQRHARDAIRHGIYYILFGKY